MRCLKTLLFASAVAATCSLGFAQTNLPLGLPADQILPLKLEGYKLVSIDRTKEVIFDIEGKRVVVECPIFIYLPESDKAAEMREGLKAIHADIARLASQREPIDPQRLMTTFLALDGLLSKPDPVTIAPKDVRPIGSPASAPKPQSPLQSAISRTDG